MVDPFSVGEEQNFRSAFEWSAIGMALVSPDGRFLHVNSALADMLGYSVDELKRLDFQTLTHPQDLDADLAQVQQMLDAKIRSFKMEKRYFHRDGHIVWAHLTVSLVWDLECRPLHFISQIQDITQQKLAAEKLQQSEARLRVMWESSLDGMRITDADGIVLHLNDAYCKLVGKSRAELEGRHYSEAYVSAGHAQMRENYRARFADRSVVPRFETEVTFQNGRSACLELSNAFLQQDGQEPLLFTVFRDLSERQRADAALAQLAAIVESSEDAIVGKSLDGRIFSWNRGAEQMYGYRAEEVLGRTDAFLRPPGEIDAAAFYLERITEGLRVDNFETVHLTRDERRIDVSLSLSPIKNTTGRIAGYSTIARDVTGYKQRARELEEAKEAAELASRAKSDFLANVSHEIRTPMNGIIGMTQLALDTELSPEQQDYLETVRGCAETLLCVLNDILDLSRTENGSLKVCCVPFDLRECVYSALAPFAETAAENGLRFIADVAPDVPEHIAGDKDRLAQVLGNLLGNALKFTRVGEIETNLRVRETPGGLATLLEFQVRDTGIGIHPDKQEVIFDAFAQADGSATRRYGGTGLGLAISRRLVELMGGRLWVESVPGVGSTFHFTLRCPPATLKTVESGIPHSAKNKMIPTLSPEVVRSLHQSNGDSAVQLTPVVKAASVLDRKQLQEIVADDAELLAELIELFNRDSPLMLAEIRTGIAAQDADLIARAAHTLKGSLMNLAAPAATEAAFRMERVGKVGGLAEAEKEFAALQGEVRLLAAELAALNGMDVS